MNYTEDKTANNTNFAVVGMMPAFSWKEDEEEHFFNESEIQEGIDKVKGLIESEDPAIVLLVGMVLGLYWFGRGVECGPLVVEDDEDRMYYLLPSTTPNPTYSAARIREEFIRCGEYLHQHE
ncbi:uncharacterized protein EV154DRAFT_487134 [Mucor mucedo]|uniref:uncharacterized protein n=1 Tax=Mucor mucedo TaxID=29922 RepID=UPI00222123B2|nr:uncharacterized protein EV154DRAFT_487134 [Mucor mucedo]KAI7873568.1 hypothetical protein EV154DRAFT_487134 [Mucor mucedo]